MRALHHYDRLGLLKPQRAASSYRVYSESDLGTLERIIALKFIGIPLRDIKRLLRGGRSDFASVLAAQRIVLEEKRRRVSLSIAAIREVQAAGPADASGLKRIIEVITMQEQRDEFKKQYDALLQGKSDRLRAMAPEARQQLRERFAALAAEIREALSEDPASPRAQELAGRWLELLQAFAPKGAIDPQLLKMGATYLSDRHDRRRRGKDDDLDAQNTAHAAFAGKRVVTPKTRDGMVESLRRLAASPFS